MVVVINSKSIEKEENMGDHQKQNAQCLYTELTDFERKGIDISLNGWPASPMQIVQAHMMREDISYMRDYMMNDDGDVKEVGFYGVKI